MEIWECAHGATWFTSISGSGTSDGVKGDHIQVSPPLVTLKAEIDEIVALLVKSIGEVEAGVL